MERKEKKKRKKPKDEKKKKKKLPKGRALLRMKYNQRLNKKTARFGKKPPI